MLHNWFVCLAAVSCHQSHDSIARRNPSTVTSILLGKTSYQLDLIGDDSASAASRIHWTLFVNLLSIYITKFSINEHFNRSAYLSLSLISDCTEPRLSFASSSSCLIYCLRIDIIFIIFVMYYGFMYCAMKLRHSAARIKIGAQLWPTFLAV